MEIKNSLDWSAIDTELMVAVSNIKNPRNAMQARKMLRNFQGMITTLSKLELESRRSPYKSMTRVNEQLEKINTEINNFEQWITMLLLIG